MRRPRRHVPHPEEVIPITSVGCDEHAVRWGALDGRLYFAYGSNLLRSRLQAGDRAPSAELVSAAIARGYALRFHKRGADGSGKCDLHETGADADLVWGLVWRISAGDLEQLDRSEGSGYRRRVVTLRAETQNLQAETYIAKPNAVDPALVPFDWYRDIVTAGARQGRLPPAWIRRLEEQAVVEDGNEERRARFLALLS